MVIRRESIKNAAMKAAEKEIEYLEQALEEQEEYVEKLEGMIANITGYEFDDFSPEALAARHEFDLLKEFYM